MNFLWFATAVCCLLQLQTNCAAVKFQEVMDVIKEKRMDLSKHKFFEFLRDESIPERRRMTFAPYWTTFVLGGTDVLDNWIRVPEQKNDLELRINAFADEECFHYNLFLHDVETVLGCSVEKFGMFTTVLIVIFESECILAAMYIIQHGCTERQSLGYRCALLKPRDDTIPKGNKTLGDQKKTTKLCITVITV